MQDMEAVIDGAMIKLKGDLLISSGDAFKKILLAAGKEKKITLDFEGVTDIDTAGIQLLCAAQRSAAKSKSFTLAGPLTARVRNRLETGGFVHCAGCPQKVENKCLWRGGSER